MRRPDAPPARAARDVRPRAASPVTFEEFFDANYRRLGGAMYLMVGNLGEAEDLAQEAMARVYERWPRVSAMDSPMGYAYRVAVNLARRRGRRPATEQLGDAGETSDHADLVAIRRDTIQALSGLSQRLREAVVLVDYLGFDSASAGSALGIDASSVRVRLHRARAELRATLGAPDA